MLTACFSPSAPVGLPCGDGQSCPEGQTCDIVSNECGPPSEALIWLEDSAADFTGTGDVTVEPQGFLSSAAYLTGGVEITAYNGLLIPDLAAASFDDVVASNTPSGTALRHGLHIDFQQRTPPGLGVVDGDNVTILVEGEIELEVEGAWRFELTANDQGFFEIAAPGSDTFERQIDDADVTTIETYMVTTPGWHRFRAAFQDANQFFDFRLRYDPPNVQGSGFRDPPSDRVRVRLPEIGGLLVDGFDHQNLIDITDSILISDLKDVALATDPYDLPLGTSYSMRWNGQFLVDTGGDYTFSLTSPNGHRLWIDGVSVADAFDDGDTTVTAPLALAAGWHDLVLDINKAGSASGTMSFLVDSGPQFAGDTFPADHLRPVLGRGARMYSDINTSALALPDGTGATATRTLTFERPASVVRSVDLRAAVEVTADSLDTISVVLDPPAGSNITIAAVGDMTGMGTEFFHVPLATTNAGTTWGFIGNDTVADALVGEITRCYVTEVFDGGIAPFAPTSFYESAVRELGEVVAFERVAFTVRQADDPGAVVVRVRTCDTADGCASEPYIDVTSNTVPDLPLRRFAQYRVELTSDGDTPPALDAFELRYFVRGMQ